MRSIPIVSGLLILSALACAPGAVETPAATPSVEAAEDPETEVLRFRNEHITALVDYRDMDRIVSHYLADATMAPPGEAAATGQAAIRARLEAFFARSLFGVNFENRAVYVAGDLAVIRDAYTVVLLPRGGPQSQHQGEDIWVLRRVAGNWRIASLLWTEDSPGAP